MEPRGFRRFTYYIDRPDVLSTFRVRITADAEECPVLLANGNLVKCYGLPDGRQTAVWHDPYPKPSYLFALVGGKLGHIRDTYTTADGRVVDLFIYCDPGNEERCQHALRSLKEAMAWDEERFGLSYDLDRYMIVAVDSFNMGAMENKGLNIFNSAYILADDRTATDRDLLHIERVVAHEYFHNWTGNRVTCRDWFQLTLKEGLTVFRDQCFMEDRRVAALRRIEDVHRLRLSQFPEDAGPNAHPIQPDSYLEINNFYTPTVYEKGAEVIRMIETIFGREGFTRGLRRYIDRFDGQAVTTTDFLRAMWPADAPVSMEQFQRWYRQPGTPLLRVTSDIDEKEGRYRIHVTQQNNTAALRGMNEPLLIPLRIGLIDEYGNDIRLSLRDRSDQPYAERGVLFLREREETFSFSVRSRHPLMSANRHFSAPVRIETDQNDNDRLALLKNDNDMYNRLEAGYTILSHVVRRIAEGEVDRPPEIYLAVYRDILNCDDMEDAIKAAALSLPALAELLPPSGELDITRWQAARNQLLRAAAAEHYTRMADIYSRLTGASRTGVTNEAIGKRALRNTLLRHMSWGDRSEYDDLLWQHYESADNMTDRAAALVVAADRSGALPRRIVDHFYRTWRKEPLVLHKWLAARMAAVRVDPLSRLEELERLPEYREAVPNDVRALWGTFGQNLAQLYRRDGQGLAAYAKTVVRLDKRNPLLAARLAGSFAYVPRLPSRMKPRALEIVDNILAEGDLSNNTYEVISNIRKAEGLFP